jgi:hypothetical protein
MSFKPGDAVVCLRAWGHVLEFGKTYVVTEYIEEAGELPFVKLEGVLYEWYAHRFIHLSMWEACPCQVEGIWFWYPIAGNLENLRVFELSEDFVDAALYHARETRVNWESPSWSPMVPLWILTEEEQ